MQETKTEPIAEYISMGHHLTMYFEDGKFWVDTGHADVGPFDTRKAARDHIQTIINNNKDHGIGF